MHQYVYAFLLERRDDEVFFVFPRFPEIVSAVPAEVFDVWDGDMKLSHAEDAVITALQSIVLTRDVIPEPDDRRDRKAAGFVWLSTLQAMKLELARVFADTSCSVADFARKIDKHDTAARRLLNLRHRSATDEIEEALAVFGRRLDSQWDTELITHPVMRALTGA